MRIQLNAHSFPHLLPTAGHISVVASCGLKDFEKVSSFARARMNPRSAAERSRQMMRWRSTEIINWENQ